jgi:23S rRNA pseudouridine2605 synthase
MRLQQFLAQAGYGARRKCEALIIAGRVTVNGRGATIGQNMVPGDDVRVDGKRVRHPEKKIYIALHKPVGIASDRSNPTAPTMFDLVAMPQRLFGVGRLDKDSSGLILLTNDGDFAYRLTHPSFEHQKEYRVLVKGTPDAHTLANWRKGVLLEDEDTPTAPCEVQIVETRPGASLLSIVMHEGRKRQIRRIAKLLGHPVIELVRVRVGSVRLGTLQSGEWRHLSEMEVRALLN